MSSYWNRPPRGFRRKPDTVLAAILACVGLLAGCGEKKDAAAPEGPPKAPGSEAQSSPVIRKDRESMVSLHGEMRILPGMKVVSEQKLEMKDGIIATTSSEGKTQGRMTMSDVEKRRVEYVSEKEKRVVLEEKQLIIHMETGGAEPLDTDVTSALEGRELTALRRKDGQWWFGLTEGEADATAVSELVDMGQREMLATGTYPEEPHAPGDAWESPLETVAALLGTGFQASGGKVTMRVDQLVSFEGQRCAEIGVTLSCTGSYAGSGAPMEMTLEMTGSILRSLNAFQDLRIKLDGPVKLEASQGEGMGVVIEGNLHFSLENHVTRE